MFSSARGASAAAGGPGLEELLAQRGVGVHHHHDVAGRGLRQEPGQLLVERPGLALGVPDGLHHLDPEPADDLHGAVATVVGDDRDRVGRPALRGQRRQRLGDHRLLVVRRDQHVAAQPVGREHAHRGRGVQAGHREERRSSERTRGQHHRDAGSAERKVHRQRDAPHSSQVARQSRASATNDQRDRRPAELSLPPPECGRRRVASLRDHQNLRPQRPGGCSRARSGRRRPARPARRTARRRPRTARTGPVRSAGTPGHAARTRTPPSPDGW